MGVESASDVAAFLDVNEHAVEALLTRASGETRPVAGIFDSDVVEVGSNRGIGVEMNEPMFVTHTTKIGTFAKNDTLTIRAIVYKIKEGLIPDADGWLGIKLEAP